MHRRTFLAAGAAVAATPTIAAAAAMKHRDGKVTTLKGYVRQVADHYYVISPTPAKTDPRSERYADWPADCVRVYPENLETFTGSNRAVEIRGRLHRGKTQDMATGKVALATLTEAVLA
jgi:hypothetical protein